MAWINIFRPFKLIKPLMPKNLFGRILLIFIIPLLFITIISLYVFLDKHLDSLTRKLSSNIAGEIGGLTELYQKTGIPLQELDQFSKKNFQISVKAASYKAVKAKKTVRSLTRSFGISFLDDALKSTIPYSFVTSISKDNIYIDVALPHETLLFKLNRQRLLSKTTPVYLMWVLGLPIFLLIVAALFIRNQVRPIRILARSADKLGKGLNSPEINPSGATEVRQAIMAFNRMRERIIRQIRQRTEMLAGVSHDLRTPLTRMELQLSMLEDTPDVVALRKDVKDMRQMIDSYLAFAKGEQDSQSVMTNLYDLIEAVAEPFGNKIKLPKRQSARRQVKTQSLKRCFHNLLANSDKYSKNIQVDIQKSGDEFKISIDDDGPGIPEDKFEEVFKPFYRLDDARNLDIAGTGLGLSIAQDVIHQHGGTISLGSSSLGGLRVTITLPN